MRRYDHLDFVEWRDGITNFSDREGFDINAIALHYTASTTYTSSFRWHTMDGSNASAHFYGGRSGHFLQGVELLEKAWTLGKAEMWYDGKLMKDPNRWTVNIELANLGLVQEEGGKFFYEVGRDMKPYPEEYEAPQHAELTFHDPVHHNPNRADHAVLGWWEPYPDAQIENCAKLCAELVSKFDIPLQRIVGHEDVAVPAGRKTDPGPLFPWEGFMQNIVGILEVPMPDDIWRAHRTVR